MDIYERMMKEYKFTRDELRIIERKQIAYRKFMNDPPPTENHFEDACRAVWTLIAGTNLLFATVVDLKFPDKMISEGMSTARKKGPGFLNTDMKYDGTN